MQPEARARARIVELLVACGWAVQDREEMNLGAALGVAVRDIRCPQVPAIREGAASAEFIVFPRSEEVDSDFLKFTLHHSRFVAFASHLVAGDRPRIDAQQIGDFPILLPPRAEQRRIVARIEELFDEIEAGEQEIERAREELAAYRRAALKAAVIGELTQDWRKQNRTGGTASDLLLRVRDAVRSGRRRRSATAEIDRGGLPSIPEHWAWSTLGEVCEIVGGITVDAKRVGNLDEVPYLRVANVQRGKLDLSKIKTIKAPRERIEQLRLKPNDVLLNEGGDKDKVGRGWVWSAEISVCIHQNHIFRARPIAPEIDGRFISTYANEVGRRYFFDQAKQTTNLASLNMTKVSALPVPLPPPNELARIVEIITAVATAVDECERQIDQRCGE